MKEKEKKRLNCYVDLDTYNRFKRILDIMGITVTDYINQSMIEFIDNMEKVILNQDKEAFIQMIAKNIDEIQDQIAEELKK